MFQIGKVHAILCNVHLCHSKFNLKNRKTRSRQQQQWKLIVFVCKFSTILLNNCSQNHPNKQNFICIWIETSLSRYLAFKCINGSFFLAIVRSNINSNPFLFNFKMIYCPTKKKKLSKMCTRRIIKSI